MARKSRKKINTTRNIYKDKPVAAVYVRLSKEEHASDTLLNQQNIVVGYLEQKRIPSFRIYGDDGYSGVNFNRPGFIKMRNDIKAGRINCVAVKDLSRLGRDFFETGELLENMFPAHQIRFISVNEGIDTQDAGGDFIGIPVMNLVNQLYAQDISMKTASAMKIKKEKGEFVGSFAPYGYQKSEKFKNSLVIDPVAAKIVQKIFAMAAQGLTPGQIAHQLNTAKIIPPSAYKREQGFAVPGSNLLWPPATIKAIIANEAYTGRIYGKDMAPPVIDHKIFLAANGIRKSGQDG